MILSLDRALAVLLLLTALLLLLLRLVKLISDLATFAIL